MSDNDRDKKLDQLLDIIKKAPAMNGGFTRLQDAVNQIQDANTKVLYELQLVKSSQDVHIKKIDELHTALYEPDQGIYRRVATALEANELQTSQITKVEGKTDFLSKKMGIIETKQDALEAVAGEGLKELRSTISTRKNMMRAFWAFTLAAIGGFAKFLWDILPVLF